MTRSRGVLLTGALLLVLVIGAYALLQWQASRAEKEFAELRERLSEKGGDATERNRLGLELSGRGEQGERVTRRTRGRRLSTAPGR